MFWESSRAPVTFEAPDSGNSDSPLLFSVSWSLAGAPELLPDLGFLDELESHSVPSCLEFGTACNVV